jgi:uncharacterized membrane protein
MTLHILRTFLIYFILCIATFLMLRIVIDYSAFHDDTRFLRYKLDYIHIPVWKTAFYIHVFTGILALMAGFTQFSAGFLNNHRSLHRFIGRLYAILILFINFPAGMVLAVNANGLLPSRIAFTLLDCLWFAFTAKAVLAARQGRIKKHKQYMIRSYALTFSAITLRSWKIILANTVHPDALTLYMIDAWMGFVPNLLIAEWLIHQTGRTAATAPISRSSG